MEIEGVVSLWGGNFNSIIELENYVSLGYTADGDQIYSKFANEFDIGHIDDDSIEYEFYKEQLVTIEVLLKSFSYSEIISDRFKNLLGKNKFDKPVNAIVLLYDYKHEEDIISSDNVKYIGCVSYL
ncbi:immunity 22 family protein [Clostridium estertheticum]|uniref:immunity 22 family protein n=1 Tax=Clostridium estertheticum TaxID=238834 RepID=UPI001CF1142E|nr:immunity 22 family protein [Clostridium estertheticum]MCB2343367.1 immunity 22 family protein [Clostridium estertheticum]